MERFFFIVVLLIAFLLTGLSIETLFQAPPAVSAGKMQKTERDSLLNVPPSFSTTPSFLTEAEPIPSKRTTDFSSPSNSKISYTEKAQKKEEPSGRMQRVQEGRMLEGAPDISAILASPRRDEELLRLVRSESQYSQIALLKIAELQLSHLAPDLRSFLEMRKNTPRRDKYFDIYLLKTLERLKGGLSDQEKGFLRGEGIRSWR